MVQPSPKTVGLLEAKTHLSAIVERVQRTGQPVRVTRRGEPIVDIRPVRPEGPPKRSREAFLAEAQAFKATASPMTSAEIREAIEEGRA